jgi:1-aminocyclopropane-1-carboxylate deaminase/D-cysteine desulfhydrase-like pyridoxal-dependent ACC family enzyme
MGAAATTQDGASSLPRVALCVLPTPLIEAKNLTASLQGPRLLVKRDDLTGLAMGGNKTRACEFVLADARASDCDVVPAGLFLDPVYTGRVMAAIADQIREGLISRRDTVIFYHSGGIPAIFSHCNAESS